MNEQVLGKITAPSTTCTTTTTTIKILIEEEALELSDRYTCDLSETHL